MRLRSFALMAATVAVLVASPQADQTSPFTLQPPTPPANASQPEITTRQEPATFSTHVNVVSVPVVVRDSKGNALGGLTKDDFQLFDRSKLQTITQFTLQKSGEKSAPEIAAETHAAAPTAPAQVEGEPKPAAIAQRFIAYVFDDRHLAVEEVARTRDAAMRHLASLQPTDRAAVYTTSGQNQVEFTDEREKLRQAMLGIVRRPLTDSPGTRTCPDIGYFQADLIYNKRDPIAINASVQDTAACMAIPPSAALSLVQGEAQHVLSAGNQETHSTLAVIRAIVRRLSGMPGQRTIILVSPGFLTISDFEAEKVDIVESAVRANVLINSLDARGLWVDPSIDASRPNNTSSSAMLNQKTQYERASALAQSTVLAQVAHGTGGSLYENSNDLDEGFRRLATAPEYLYLLGFSPQNLKLDGAFHELKVTLKASAGASVQARHGYFAPSKPTDPAEVANHEIEEAFLSRDETSEIPVDMRTQFFKTGDKEAKLTVRCRIDLKHVHFRKADGRNRNTLTIVSGIFDSNGEYVSGIKRTVDLNLMDETLTKLMNSGVAVNTDHTVVAPGTYVVRLIVRDSEGQMMSAVNGTVAVP